MILFLGGHPAYVGIYSILMRMGCSIARVYDPNHSYKAVIVGVYDEPTLVFDAVKIAYQGNCPLLCLSTGDMFSAVTPNHQNVAKEAMTERWRPSLGLPTDYNTARIATALAAESELMSVNSQTTVFRLFDVYGSGCAGWVNNQIENAKSGKDILIPSPVRQTRGFLYVEDLESLLQAWLDKPVQGIFHVGSSFEADLLCVAELVKEYTESKSALKHTETSQFTWWRLPDTKRVAAIYKWKASTSVRLGLKKMV